MTEVVLLFPIFMVILFMMTKLFTLLVLVQKLEIASYYAARRWQLESHLSTRYADKEDKELEADILRKAKDYLGANSTAVSDGAGETYSQKRFLGIKDVKLVIVRTQVWNMVTLTVETESSGIGLLCKADVKEVCADYEPNPDCASGYNYLCGGGNTLEVIKYVPNRDRPIQFVLPGLQ